MRRAQDAEKLINEAQQKRFLENSPEHKEFLDIAKEVAQLPKDQQTKVALFAQGVIAATAAGVGNAEQ